MVLFFSLFGSREPFVEFEKKKVTVMCGEILKTIVVDFTRFILFYVFGMMSIMLGIVGFFVLVLVILVPTIVAITVKLGWQASIFAAFLLVNLLYLNYDKIVTLLSKDLFSLFRRDLNDLKHKFSHNTQVSNKVNSP